MVVLDPNNSQHVLKIIIRDYDSATTHDFLAKNENTGVQDSLNIVSKTYADGFTTYTVDLVTAEGDSYSVKIVDKITEEVVWRGKMFTTSQNKQNYSVNG